MRTLNNIIDEVIAVIEAIERLPLKVQKAFPARLMDIPLSDMLVTVGVASANVKTASVSTYSGLKSNSEWHSAPADIKLSANIYLPNTANGMVNYDVLSYIIAALLESDIPISEIDCGKMSYNSTFMCTMLPVTLTLHDRIY